MDKNQFTLDFLRMLVGGDNVPNYSEQEQAALRKEVPMTQELFESCLNACTLAGNFAEFMDLFEWFPECGHTWCERLDKEFPKIEAALKAPGKEPKTITSGDIQSRWAAFRERVRTEYGDDVADRLTEEL